jgi:hypothetical protein
MGIGDVVCATGNDTICPSIGCQFSSGENLLWSGFFGLTCGYLSSFVMFLFFYFLFYYFEV